MGKLFIGLAFLIVAGYMSYTYIAAPSGSSNDTIKSEMIRIGNSGINELKKIDN